MTSDRNGTVRTRWWWVRHAPVRSDGGRIYGQADLSCDCRDTHVFDALARVLPSGALWFSSHLARTRETMQAIWAADDVAPAGPPREIRDFAEQHLGAWQGLDRAGFFASRPENPGSYWFGPAEERPPGGESFVDLFERTRAGIGRLGPECRGRDVVAVAHGGTIRAALAVALGIAPQGALAFAIENCSVTRLDHIETEGGSGWRVVMVNHQPWAALDARVPGQPSGPELALQG
ncbi:MAG TPA: histidine phosphatase family protein [Enterovirga sp.]